MRLGTAPNAIAFASGHIKIKEMMKAGLVMNIVAIILITLFCWRLLPLLLMLLEPEAGADPYDRYKTLSHFITFGLYIDLNTISNKRSDESLVINDECITKFK